MDPEFLQFSTLAGPIPVRTSDTSNGVTATLTSAPTRTRAARAQELDAALAALGRQRSDLDPHYPAHAIYAGNDHLVLAVRERSLLAALTTTSRCWRRWWLNGPGRRCTLVWTESRTLFDARDPFPPGGVIEDPATGAAAPRPADTYAHRVWSSCPRESRSRRARTWAAQPTPRRPQHRRRRRSVDRHRSPPAGHG
jgi:predicted PhzF superfamily epimerase YddE/YHI9